MSRRPAGWIVAACLTALATLPAAAVEPLRLIDPATGEQTTVAPDAPLLHLFFFATWCPPCLDDLDRLSGIDARWKDRGYRLVLVAVETRQTAERIGKFVERRNPPGSTLFDLGGAAAAAVGADQVPTHVLLDSRGNELYRSGALDAGLTATIESTLAGEGR